MARTKHYPPDATIADVLPDLADGEDYELVFALAQDAEAEAFARGLHWRPHRKWQAGRRFDSWRPISPQIRA